MAHHVQGTTHNSSNYFYFPTSTLTLSFLQHLSFSEDLKFLASQLLVFSFTQVVLDISSISDSSGSSPPRGFVLTDLGGSPGIPQH